MGMHYIKAKRDPFARLQISGKPAFDALGEGNICALTEKVSQS